MKFIFKDLDGAITIVSNPSTRQIQFAKPRTVIRYSGKVYVFQLVFVGDAHFFQCQEPQFFRDGEGKAIAEQLDALIDEARSAGYHGGAPDSDLRDDLLARLGAMP